MTYAQRVLVRNLGIGAAIVVAMVAISFLYRIVYTMRHPHTAVYRGCRLVGDYENVVRNRAETELMYQCSTGVVVDLNGGE